METNDTTNVLPHVWYTLKEVEKILKVGRSQLYRLRKGPDCLLASYRGSMVRVKGEDLIKFMADGRK
jgi:hypothetical protein